jgi:glutaredoxin 3
MEEKPVELYTWSYCPYCQRAKALLDEKNIPYTEHVMDDREEELNELRAKTGQRSVPQIFIKGKFIGGCDNLYELEEKGELDSLI